MKTLHLRVLVGLLLLTLFSQTLLAATRMVHCAFPGNEPAVIVMQEPSPASPHCHTEEPAAAPHATMHQSMDDSQHSSHCQPDCSCCWNACSASLLVNSRIALALIPATETYHSLSALLPASPVEQSLRPPRFS